MMIMSQKASSLRILQKISSTSNFTQNSLSDYSQLNLNFKNELVLGHVGFKTETVCKTFSLKTCLFSNRQD
jgi:hypothetical protein